MDSLWNKRYKPCPECSGTMYGDNLEKCLHCNGTGSVRKSSESKTTPLFVPLKREYFEAFADGSKKHEYRMFGKRWNKQTCMVGRPVTLSCGYGKQRRLSGIIKSIEVENEPSKLPGWVECYGKTGKPAIIIEIEVTR